MKKPEHARGEPFHDLERFGDLKTEHLATMGFKLQPMTGFERYNTVFDPEMLGPELVNAMHHMNLGFYMDDVGNLLVGSQDSSLHRHDRWLYVQPQGYMDWFHLDLDTPRPYPLTDGIVERIVQSSDSCAGYEPTKYWMTYRVPVGLVPHLQPLLDQQILKREDFHDLIFHYPAWAQRNPDYREMPREIVMRMHGFGPMLAKVAELGLQLPLAQSR